MYDKYNYLQWHNFFIIIIIHHELGLFWSHLTVSSKVFQVVFIWSTFRHNFWYPVVYSCCMSLNERGITFIQNFIKIGHPVQKKHTHTHKHTYILSFFVSLSKKVHKYTYILSLTLAHKNRERKKRKRTGSHWCALTLNRKSCISHLGTCPRVLRILF